MFEIEIFEHRKKLFGTNNLKFNIHQRMVVIVLLVHRRDRTDTIRTQLHCRFFLNNDRFLFVQKRRVFYF